MNSPVSHVNVTVPPARVIEIGGLPPAAVDMARLDEAFTATRDALLAG